MKKKDLNWAVVGLVMSEFIALVTIIRETFERMAVRIEIVPWLCGEGRDAFVMEFLEPLGQRFLATQRVKVIDEHTILVNLGASPKLPFPGATVHFHEGEGWVEVQRRPDGLYVGDRKVILHLSERQIGGGRVEGHELRNELTGKPVLNANLLDALIEHTHLIPDGWKVDEQGRTRLIYFWATIYYRSADRRLYVRYLYFRDGRWYYLDYDWLGDGWSERRLAALLGS